MRKVTISFIILLSIAGCAGRQQLETKTRERKARSLAGYGKDTIQAIVPFPETPGSDSKVRGFDPKDFLSIHSGWLVSGEDLDEEAFLAQFEERQETRRDTGINLKLNIHTDAPSAFGACIPISQDGYFLTADHNLDFTNRYIVYFTSDEVHTFARGARCRLVERYGDADLALLHVDIETPRYLRLAEEPLTKGDEVFGGNTWVGQAAAGKYLRELKARDATNRDEDEGIFKYTDMPSLPGDSGSALINREGELCGIIVRVMVSEGLIGPFSVRRDYAIAASLDKEAITAAITRDRAAEK